ncbi:MAG: PQQ-binding-like beta-propeller repeat protein [Acidobacteriota bacterium]
MLYQLSYRPDIAIGAEARLVRGTSFTIAHHSQRLSLARYYLYMRFLTVLCAASSIAFAADSTNWPGFRGADAQGVASGKVPTLWNADSDSGPARNIRFKVAVPGLAHSSPVIWGDKIFLTSAVSEKGDAPLKVGLYGAGDPADDNGQQRWVVFCLDKRTGKLLWQQTAQASLPKTQRHTKATHSNSTPVTDGKRLIAYFGSQGVYAYSLDGKLLWSKDLGTFDIGPQGYDLQWGTASSPVLYQDKVLVQCDQKKGSFLVALDALSGRELWRANRDGVSHQSWATPAVIAAAGRTQVVTNGWPNIASYDLSSGKELWRLKSLGDIVVPTPILAHGLIFLTNAHGGPAPLYAVKSDASGDITPAAEAKSGPGLAWMEPRNGAYMQTPLVLGDLLYSCSDRGVLKVYDARTGALRYTQRIGEGTTGFTSSPVTADGKIYFASEEGEVYVLKAGATYELVSRNLLGEIAMATPAVSEGTIYYRTRGHLVAIRSEDK